MGADQVLFRLKLHEEALKKGKLANRRAVVVQKEKEEATKEQERHLERLQQEVGHMRVKVIVTSWKLTERSWSERSKTRIVEGEVCSGPKRC